MNDQYTERAARILETIRYATVATVCSNQAPWNSPVAHTMDKNLTIYWASDKDGQHSINIRQNSAIFIVIYDSTAPEGQGEGVYIEAEASELSDPSEILFVRRLKKGANYAPQDGEFLDKEVRRIYKAVPKRIWINDAEENNGIFVRDYRVELSLSEVKDALQKPLT